MAQKYCTTVPNIKLHMILLYTIVHNILKNMTYPALVALEELGRDAIICDGPSNKIAENGGSIRGVQHQLIYIFY